MIFEKHLRSFYRAVSRSLDILRKSWQVFHDRLHLGICLRCFVLTVLEYCSALWWSAADTHLKQLDRVVSDASFWTGGVFKCDLAHRRSVAVLCMLYKIRCNPMYLLYDALPEPYVPVHVTISAVIEFRYTNPPPRCWTSQYHRTLIRLSVSLWNVLGGPVFDDVGLAGFKSRANAFLLACIGARAIFVSCCIYFLFFYSMGWYCVAVVFGLIGC